MIQLSADDRRWVDSVWEKINLKMSAQCDRIGSSVPYAAVNGCYTDKMADNIYWWTNGFWPGMLWLMYHSCKDEKYLKAARKTEEKLDSALAGFEGLDHDVGFMWTLASVLDFRLTGDKTARTRALHAANILAGRFNPRGKFIRAWNKTPDCFVKTVPPQYCECTGWIIIDCLMNLPLLFWAGEQLLDPRFNYIACDHADTALKHMVRDDGSCNHIVILDPANGSFLEAPAGQGFASGSSWTRGQAWALYGFAIAYRYTGKKSYLDAARRVANYFYKEVSHFNFIPPVDFLSPAEPYLTEPNLIDTSAGSIAACGLMALNRLQDALNLLKAIEAAYGNWDIDSDGLIKMATAQYHGRLDERHVPIIYGDYFFMEALNCLRGSALQIW